MISSITLAGAKSSFEFLLSSSRAQGPTTLIIFISSLVDFMFSPFLNLTGFPLHYVFNPRIINLLFDSRVLLHGLPNLKVFSFVIGFPSLILPSRAPQPYRFSRDLFKILKPYRFPLLVVPRPAYDDLLYRFLSLFSI